MGLVCEFERVETEVTSGGDRARGFDLILAITRCRRSTRCRRWRSRANSVPTAVHLVSGSLGEELASKR